MKSAEFLIFVFFKVMQQHLKCDGLSNVGFVGNLMLFTAVKELCKSIKN